MPELRQLICSDGTALPATASPVLQRWFAKEPEKAAASQLWLVYPRTTRQGLAVFVVGAASAATDVELAKLHRRVDRFDISGVVANQRTDKSSIGAVVVVRVTRNVPRPAGRPARHPNWKPHLLFLRGGLRPSSKYKGAFVNLVAKRTGNELRLVGVRSSGQRPPDPIAFGWPRFDWPWPFGGTSAEIATWCRAWWAGERQRFIDSAEFQPLMPRVPEGLLTRADRRPPFFCADWPAAEAAMFQRLDRFVLMQKLLIERYLLPMQKRIKAAQQAAGTPEEQNAVSAAMAGRMATDLDRLRLVVLRLRRRIESMDVSTRTQLYESTGLPYMLEEQLDGYEAACFLVAPPAIDGGTAAEPNVQWFGMPVYQADLVSRMRVTITGKLKKLVLDKLSGWYNGLEITGARGDDATTHASGDAPTQPKDYGMSASLLEIGELIAAGSSDNLICRTFDCWPGEIRKAAERLIDTGWAEDKGLVPDEVTSDALDATGIRSAAMRQALRHYVRQRQGLTLHGRAPKVTHDPV